MQSAVSELEPGQGLRGASPRDVLLSKHRCTAGSSQKQCVHPRGRQSAPSASSLSNRWWVFHMIYTANRTARTREAWRIFQVCQEGSLELSCDGQPNLPTAPCPKSQRIATLCLGGRGVLVILHGATALKSSLVLCLLPFATVCTCQCKLAPRLP